MKTNTKSRYGSELCLYGAVILLQTALLTACEQNFGIAVSNSQGNLAGETSGIGSFGDDGRVSTTTDPENGSGPGHSGQAGFKIVATSESFPLTGRDLKKVDFLFVVDNSKSMAPSQAKLTAGFQKFADTFYKRPDLDICTAIITSDRYLGRMGGAKGTYPRERFVGCTKPANAAHMPPQEMNAYIDSLIARFQRKVNVGIEGSGYELLGKSLVTFLYDLNKWSDTPDTSVRNAFFRKDAVANITLITDENNYYFSGYPGTLSEANNDLPAVTGTQIYNAAPGTVDTRVGIKNHLDRFFGSLSPNGGVNYSVTDFIQLNLAPTTVSGLSMNLLPLSDLIGRESTKADLAGDTSAYTDVYQSISDTLVKRADAISLKYTIYEPAIASGSLSGMSINVVHASGHRQALAFNSDFSIMMPNGISLTPEVISSLQAGDTLEVNYQASIPL